MFVTRFRTRVHSVYLTVAMLAALLFAPPAAIADAPADGTELTLTLRKVDGSERTVRPDICRTRFRREVDSTVRRHLR